VSDTTTEDSRREVLSACGAVEHLLEELLAYTARRIRDPGDTAPRYALVDEPHVETWLGYEEEAREIGAFAALQRRFAQLQFPIASGMSEDATYRAATRRGIFAPTGGAQAGLELLRPEAVELTVCETMAGRIPVIVAPERSDFVSLVRAFTGRSEPVDVPDSMGACMVSGLNNWHRIRAYRESWESAQARPPSEAMWSEEFRRLVPRKELYQDRFVMLSIGPYSAVAADDIGLEWAEWSDLSLVIRREHEFTHYFTLRMFGTMRNHLLDELIADFVGLVRATGSYKRELALRFLGLESHPEYRDGGRLQAYRGDPSLSDGAFAVLQEIAVRAAGNFQRTSDERPELLVDLNGLARLTHALAALSLEELASENMPEMVARELARQPERVALSPRARSTTP